MESIDKTQFLSDGGGGGLVMDIKAAGATPVTCVLVSAMALAGAVKKVTMGKKSVWYVDAESVGERIQERRERVRRWSCQRYFAKHKFRRRCL